MHTLRLPKRGTDVIPTLISSGSHPLRSLEDTGSFEKIKQKELCQWYILLLNRGIYVIATGRRSWIIVATRTFDQRAVPD